MSKIISEKKNIDSEKGVLTNYMNLVFNQIEKNEPIGHVFGLNEKYKESIYSLAYFNLSQSKFNEALSLFKVMMMIDQNDRRALIGCAICYKSMKDYIRAIECFGLAYIRKPDDGNTAVQIVLCLLVSGRKKEASQMIKSMEIDAERFSDHENFKKGFHSLKEIISKITENRKSS